MRRPIRALQLIGRRLRGDSLAGHQLATPIVRALAPGFVMPESGRRWMEDPGFVQEYNRLTGGSLWEQADKKFTLQNLARWMERVPGSIAECGTFRGVSAYFLAEALPDRDLHLFDSFEGLPGPSAQDGGHWSAGMLSATEQDVITTLGEHGSRAHLHRGWIPERFDQVSEERFCLVHIDVDLYAPHRDAISFFTPRVSPGGLLIFDDYGSIHCPGARAAVDKAFSPHEIVELSTGQAFVQIPG